MKTLFLCLALAGLAALGGCGEMVTRPDGTKMPAAVFAFTEANSAYVATVNQTATCDAAAADMQGSDKVAALAVCGLRSMGGRANQAPTYQAPPTMLDRIVQLAPVALGIGQLVASDRANERQTNASVQIAGIGAARELGIVQAATGSNERIATGGFSAVGNVAGVGFAALGNAATSASQASATNSQAWAGALAELPPTTQITAGGNITQAGRDSDQSTVGGDRVNGDGNRLRNTVDCVAQGGSGAPASAGNNSGAGGATSPLNATYNPLVSGGDGAAATNNCGGG